MSQTREGTYDASIDTWFSTYPDKTTQANGAEIMIWLSHPNALAGGSEVSVDGTDWYLNEWITSGHGLSWPVIIFTHTTQISSVKACGSTRSFALPSPMGGLSPLGTGRGLPRASSSGGVAGA